jgi:phosphohistidine swiveling domain-containing protein
MSSEPLSVLHAGSPADATWSTTNLSEAIPGVPSPLNWSIFYPAGELAVRRTFHRIGVLSRREAQWPASPDERLMGIHYGRAAIRVDLICTWAERIPGTDSAAAAQAAFSATPEGYVSRTHPIYYARVLAHAAAPFRSGPAQIRRHAPAVDAFWRQALEALPNARAAAARKWLRDAVGHWNEGLFNNTFVSMGAISPLIERLEQMTAPLGINAQELMAGYGRHEETLVVADASACSRGTLPFDVFLERHGYHGWHEGEISARVWREDPVPARSFIERYGQRSETVDPSLAERERRERRLELETAFLGSLPRSRRLAGHALLALCARYIPQRGAGKVTFLKGLDAARAAARRLGELLADDSTLDEPDDVFYLTLDELTSAIPTGAGELVASRRELRARYQEIEVADTFRGVPEPRRPARVEIDRIDGTAGSPGVVEGPVRVLTSPEDADIEEGEILVGRTTDPSWAAVMFLSVGLVTDIGGTLSHTAVVARELGLPCVVNTKVATRTLRTGDIVRLDGNTGQIEVLHRLAITSSQ